MRDSACDCPKPVGLSEMIAWPCYACGSLEHDRPAPGTGCGCDERWFSEHEGELATVGLAPKGGPRTWGSS